MHGFVGPNGAGKSTTIRALLGLLKPDAGMLRLTGVDPTRDPAAATARVAYVPGEVSLWPHLTAGQAIATLARLRPDGDDAARRAELIERFDLDPSKKMRTYSKGNRQKVVLVAALAANVDVLVLDEPTSGLDPLMERVFGQCVREASERGVSVLLSSHILSEVQLLADDITIIRQGRVVESGALKDLSHLRGSRITAVLPGGIPYETTTEGASVRDELQRLLLTGADQITCTPASLEDIFLDHYGTELSADERDEACGPSTYTGAARAAVPSTTVEAEVPWADRDPDEEPPPRVMWRPVRGE